MTSPKNFVGHYSKEEWYKIVSIKWCCAQQLHFVVVYGRIMSEEESLVNFENCEIWRSNILCIVNW